MTEDQKKQCKKIKDKVTETGLTQAFIAKKFGLTSGRLSRILSAKETYVSQDVIDKIEKYVYLVNTNDIDLNT